MAIDFKQLLLNMIEPLVLKPDEIVVKILSEDNKEVVIQVLVHPDDLGRIIGKGGRIAQSIRNICYAGASKEGVRLQINLDSF